MGTETTGSPYFKKRVLSNNIDKSTFGDKPEPQSDSASINLEIINEAETVKKDEHKGHEVIEGEIYEEPLTAAEIDALGSDDGVRFKTREVALQLGISEQSVRNFCSDDMYGQFLDIETTGGGHRLFSKKDIIRLKSILKLQKEYGMTVNQTKEFLKAEPDPDVALLPAKRMDFFMEQIKEMINETIKQAITERPELQDHGQQEAYEMQIAELKQSLKEKDEQINELILENKRQMAELSDQTMKEIRDMQTSSQEKIEDTIRELLQEKDKRKRKFFPW